MKDALAYVGALAVSLIIVGSCAYVLALARWGREP